MYNSLTQTTLGVVSKSQSTHTPANYYTRSGAQLPITTLPVVHLTRLLRAIFFFCSRYPRPHRYSERSSKMKCSIQFNGLGHSAKECLPVIASAEESDAYYVVDGNHVSTHFRNSASMWHSHSPTNAHTRMYTRARIRTVQTTHTHTHTHAHPHTHTHTRVHTHLHINILVSKSPFIINLLDSTVLC